MKKDKEEKENRKIPLKKYTKGGRISSLIALCNIVVIITLIGISIILKGNAGIYIGLIMLGVLVSAVIGFSIGLKSYKEENKFLTFTNIGTIANAIIWIGILGMYLIYV